MLCTAISTHIPYTTLFRSGDSTGGGKPRPEVRVIAPAALMAAESTATREVMSKKKVGYLVVTAQTDAGETRSEEHTSELQSPCMLVCSLLLVKTKHQFLHL